MKLRRPCMKRRSRPSTPAKRSADHEARGPSARGRRNMRLFAALGGRVAFGELVRVCRAFRFADPATKCGVVGNVEAYARAELLGERLPQHAAGLRGIFCRDADRHSARSCHGGEPNILWHYVSRVRGSAADP